MQTRNRTGLRTLSGILLATSAWIALASAAQAQTQTPTTTTTVSTPDYTNQLNSIKSSTDFLTNIDTGIGSIKSEYLKYIKDDVNIMKGDVNLIYGEMGQIKSTLNSINETLGNRGDVQTVTVGNSSDPCVPGEVTYSDPTNTVVNLLSQIVNILKGPTATGACTASSAALNDAMGMATLARKVAVARSVSPSYGRWKKGCEIGFNPTKYVTQPPTGSTDPNYDQEAKANKLVAADKGVACTQKDGYVRWDRSLESLLGPLEYRAPKTMAAPPADGAFYDRFANVELNDSTYPIVAAGMFCMNVAENFFPQLPVTNDFGSVETVRAREAWESKTMANCWRFFEERVAYPSDMSGDFAVRHDQQVARCNADFKANLISEQAKTDCGTYGRSTLKARADAAYRSDSETYTKFLTKGLKYESQVQILGVAAADIERFEGSLALERQIMTETLATARMAPLSSATPLDATAGAIPELLRALKQR